MPRSFVGPMYDMTLGSILRYNLLASHLHSIVAANKVNSFVDLACGTGQLLSAMNRRNGRLKLFGVDWNAIQLAEAKLRCRQTDLICGNICRPSTLTTQIPSNNVMLHLGFCFMNTLEPRKRLSLLRGISKRTKRGLFAFELQNDHHQQMRYRDGVWYKSRLTSGARLVSMSKRIASEKSAQSLIMKFEVNGEPIIFRSIMYPWRLDDCLSQCRLSGFELLKIEEATYRPLTEGIPSHWFIVCKRS